LPVSQEGSNPTAVILIFCTHKAKV
jgi:hypothetical protein